MQAPAALAFPAISADASAKLQIGLRFVHIPAGILWVGLLYFFTLVNLRFLRELDAPTRLLPHRRRSRNSCSYRRSPPGQTSGLPSRCCFSWSPPATTFCFWRTEFVGGGPHLPQLANVGLAKNGEQAAGAPF